MRYEQDAMAVVEGTKQFEYQLRRKLDAGNEEKVFLSGSDDVPNGYKEMVEEYYRSLSRTGGTEKK